MMKPPLFLTFVLLFAPQIPASTAPKTVVKTGFDPKAVALFDKSAAAYQRLKGLSAQSSVLIKLGKETLKGNGTLAFSRPGRAKIVAKFERETEVHQSDGIKVFRQVNPRKFQFVRANGDDAIQSVFVGEALFASIPNMVNLMMGSLIMGRNPLKEEKMGWNEARLLPGNGVAMAMRSDQGKVLALKVYVDPNDHLIRRVEANFGGSDGPHTQTTTLTNVRINPKFAPGAFAFKPPRGAKVVPQP